MTDEPSSVCRDCGEAFAGSVAWSRHLDRRRGKCRTKRELRRRGFVEVDGVWQHRPPKTQRQLPGMRRTGGSRRLEERGHAPQTTSEPSAAQRRSEMASQTNSEGS